MNNQLTIFIQFDFKGETHCPTSTVDLDAMMHKHGTIPALYQLLARENNIDLYSYELEVMMSLPIQIKNATGLVSKFIIDDKLDQTAFEQAWKLEATRKIIDEIAHRHLTEDVIQQYPAVLDALTEAYTLGRE